MMTTLEAFLVRAWLAGEMDTETADAFELLLLERPELAEEIEADNALRVGLAGAVIATPVEAPAISAPPATVLPFVPPRPRRWRLAVAAATLVLAGTGAGWWLHPSTMQGGAALLAYVDKTRSLSQTPQIVLGEAPWTVLMVPVTRLQPCTATVTVQPASGPVLVLQGQPDDYGYASIVLPTQALRAGPAEIDVRCDTEALGRYPVQFVAAPMPTP